MEITWASQRQPGVERAEHRAWCQESRPPGPLLAVPMASTTADTTATLFTSIGRG